MNWAEESWVRVYTRDEVDWIALPWEARALFLFLLRRVDRRGVLTLGRSGARGLAALVHMPPEVTRRALDELVADGCVALDEGALTIPNYVEAQSAAWTPRKRQEEHRARERDGLVTKRDVPSRGVTVCHARSRAVTTCHALSLPDQTRPDERRLSPSAQGRENCSPYPLLCRGGMQGGAKGEQPSPSGAERPTAPAKGRVPRERPAPAADPVPLPGTPAAAVLAAILGDPALAPITRGPGDWSQRATGGAYPGVDVAAEVRRAGEYASRHPGRYSDGRAYLSKWCQRRADELAAQPKLQAPAPKRSLREMDYRAHADDFELEAAVLGRRAS